MKGQMFKPQGASLLLMKGQMFWSSHKAAVLDSVVSGLDARSLVQKLLEL